MTVLRGLARLLRGAQVDNPDDVVATLAEGLELLGGGELTLYLVDYAQAVLQPAVDGPDPVRVEGSLAGRCFTTQELVEVTDHDPRLYVPVTERAQRLGVLELRVAGLDDDGRELATELGLLAALLVLAASAYCDRFHIQRRRQDMELAAEMQWSLLPPLSFSCGGTSVSGLLQPAYGVGGDCFDYALDGEVLSLAIFDAMGHGLASSVLANVAVGAYRHARRSGVTLAGLMPHMDAAVVGLLGDSFVTAVVAQLNVSTGVLSWISAGHAAPLLVRDRAVLAQPLTEPALPLGLGLIAADDTAVPQRIDLQPGDRVLFHTDGVVEARDASAAEFGVDRLGDLLVRESLSERPPGEVLRRLIAACHDWQGGELRDDATLLLLDWARPAPAIRVTPQRGP